MSPPIDDFITVRDWLRWAVSRFTEAQLFFGHGTDNAFDEAAYLILFALHLPPDRLDPFLDARLSRSERLAVFNIVEQRVVRRVPAAYLTHEAWLGEYRFYIDERVIVPRSYFAELLDERLAPWITHPERIQTALDLCTGSGCLAILMAYAFPGADIDAVDISADALAVARRNVDAYQLGNRIRLVRSDLLTELAGRRYDLIICNPPYVTAEAMANLPAEYRREPPLALGSGEDGLEVIRRLLDTAAGHLTPEGLLLVEVGHNRHLADAAFPDISFNWIDTPSGEGKVFLISRADLIATTAA